MLLCVHLLADYIYQRILWVNITCLYAISKSTMLLHVVSISSYQLYPAIERLFWAISIMHMGYVHFEHMSRYPFGCFTLDMPLDWSSLLIFLNINAF